MSVAIVGIGRTALSRSSGRTTTAMAVSACRDALADAGLDVATVDGMTTFQVNDSAHPMEVAWALGIPELAWANSQYAGGNAVAEQIAMAAAMIPTNGAVAILLVGEALVADVRTAPVWLVGSAGSQGCSGWSEWDDPTQMYARTVGPRDLW